METPLEEAEESFDEWVQGQKPRHCDLFKKKQFLGYGPQTNPYQEGGTRKGSCVQPIYGTEVLGDFRKLQANPSRISTMSGGKFGRDRTWVQRAGVREE